MKIEEYAMNQIIEDVGHQKHKKKPWLKEFVNLTQQPFIKGYEPTVENQNVTLYEHITNAALNVKIRYLCQIIIGITDLIRMELMKYMQENLIKLTTDALSVNKDSNLKANVKECTSISISETTDVTTNNYYLSYQDIKNQSIKSPFKLDDNIIRLTNNNHNNKNTNVNNNKRNKRNSTKSIVDIVNEIIVYPDWKLYINNGKEGLDNLYINDIHLHNNHNSNNNNNNNNNINNDNNNKNYDYSIINDNELNTDLIYYTNDTNINKNPIELEIMEINPDNNKNNDNLTPKKIKKRKIMKKEEINKKTSNKIIANKKLVIDMNNTTMEHIKRINKKYKYRKEVEDLLIPPFIWVMDNNVIDNNTYNNEIQYEQWKNIEIIGSLYCKQQIDTLESIKNNCISNINKPLNNYKQRNLINESNGNKEIEYITVEEDIYVSQIDQYVNSESSLIQNSNNDDKNKCTNEKMMKIIIDRLIQTKKVNIKEIINEYKNIKEQQIIMNILQMTHFQNSNNNSDSNNDNTITLNSFNVVLHNAEGGVEISLQ